MHRLRAVRVRVPGRRDLVEARTTTRTPGGPAKRFAKDYQINYLRCIMCGLCVEAVRRER